MTGGSAGQGLGLLEGHYLGCSVQGGGPWRDGTLIKAAFDYPDPPTLCELILGEYPATCLSA